MKPSLAVIAVTLLAATGVRAEGDAVSPEAVVFGERGNVEESLTGQPGNPEAGAEVMTTKASGNCIACHQVTALESAQFLGTVGPSLDGVADRWSEAELRGIVANAKMAFPDSMMPAFYKTTGFIRPGNAFTGKAPDGPLPPLLTGQQIEDVVAYLMTLRAQ
ncbi:sulfur-oxidizing protein SoxX [Amaricoccus macauensis]|uniref:Sulfur-oxidizing protein SoxX n=1 Tax=Amaricoccus macauensis TaxID=57001 RepID=A0A840SIF2_9RHOB|nr:sulfur oxidation c-type cytochrome SoxX [Amaricoccus macauensis]MBB5222809.1 sulfur-oxidizing protein SoxX [Amaricoccus macauensis]